MIICVKNILRIRFKVVYVNLSYPPRVTGKIPCGVCGGVVSVKLTLLDLNLDSITDTSVSFMREGCPSMETHSTS
jgi:hypothetical protein